MSLFCDDDDELQLLLLLLCLMKSGGFPFEGATLSSSPFKDELDLVRKNVLNHPPPPPRGLKCLAFAAAGAGSAMLLMLLPRPDSCLSWVLRSRTKGTTTHSFCPVKSK